MRSCDHGRLNAIAVSGTDVYLGGAFTQVSTQPRNRIARVDTSNALSSWDPNANGDVLAIAVSGTDVYTGGAFTNIGGASRNRIARLSSSTGLADAWNPNSNGSVNALAMAVLRMRRSRAQ